MTSEQEPVPLRDRPIPEIADRLQSVLGQRLVAYAIHERDPRRIGAFARGEDLPETDPEKTLRDLGQLTEEVLDTQGRSPELFRALMIGMNHHFEDTAPIQLFHDGKGERVLRVAPSFFKA
jgi:hypothetical protein